MFFKTRLGPHHKSSGRAWKLTEPSEREKSARRWHNFLMDCHHDENKFKFRIVLLSMKIYDHLFSTTHMRVNPAHGLWHSLNTLCVEDVPNLSERTWTATKRKWKILRKRRCLDSIAQMVPSSAQKILRHDFPFDLTTPFARNSRVDDMPSAERRCSENFKCHIAKSSNACVRDGKFHSWKCAGVSWRGGRLDVINFLNGPFYRARRDTKRLPFAEKKRKICSGNFKSVSNANFKSLLIMKKMFEKS